MLPFQLASGVNVRLVILAVVISSFKLTAVPLNFKVPLAGKLVILIFVIASPSTSLNLLVKSVDVKLMSVSSLPLFVTVLTTGASFTFVTVTV